VQNGDEILGSDGGTVDAEFGGKSTVSRLEVVPEVEDHGEIYACRATNVLLEQAVSDAVTLNVSCKGNVQSFDLPQNELMIE